MLLGMIGMNHLVLNSHIIPPEELDNIATGMGEGRNVVNDAIDGDFGRFERAGCHYFFGGVGCVGGGAVGFEAIAELGVGVAAHGLD